MCVFGVLIHQVQGLLLGAGGGAVVTAALVALCAKHLHFKHCTPLVQGR